MNDKELSALKALAEVATPGPWDTNTAGATKDGVFTYDEVYVYSPENRKVAIAADIADPKTGEPSVANAQFIARADPAAILSLISHIEQQSRFISELREELASRCRAQGGNTSDNASSPSPAVDLSGLTRYEPLWCNDGTAECGEDANGEYVKLTDVQALLATPARDVGDLTDA